MQRARQFRWRAKTANKTLERHIKELIGRFPPFGFRRISAMLRREGVTTNKKTDYRGVKANGWFVTQRNGTPLPRAAGRKCIVEVSDFRWAMDVTHIHCGAMVGPI